MAKKGDRVMIFIDGSNLYKAMVRYIGHYQMDFDSFVNKLCGSERRLIHTHYYNVRVNRQEEPEMCKAQQRFLSQLNQIPYFTLHLERLATRDREMKCPKCEKTFKYKFHIEKGIDVSLACHMLMYAFDDAYDVTIIVSGDGDYVTAVDEVRRLGKQVENAYFETGKFEHLRSHCKEGFISLSKDYLKDCLLYPSTTRTKQTK
ncbi:NYN domain-containing protein [candidate division WOR-3 bacterium]|nr:NYN domain-containing protein [candidate division WOR-3 bacterium]